ncbi:hypothetical protein B0H11DRAFT_2065473 [Mycena galericulata]|nr:hypothetical protein B0H11DRAFT_2065473 [Mycena galericulata]
MLSLSSAPANFCEQYGFGDDIRALLNAVCLGEAGDFLGAPDISLCELEPESQPGNVRRLRRLLNQLMAEETKRGTITMAEDALILDESQAPLMIKNTPSSCDIQWGGMVLEGGFRKFARMGVTREFPVGGRDCVYGEMPDNIPTGTEGSETASELLKVYKFTLKNNLAFVRLKWHLTEIVSQETKGDTTTLARDPPELCGGQVSDECPALHTPLEQKSKVHALSLSSTRADFCKHYCLGEEICKLLKDARVKTAGELLKISELTLKRAKFRVGHIAEVRWASREMVFGSNGDTTMKTEPLSTAYGGIGGAGGAGRRTGGNGGSGEALRGFGEGDLKHFRDIQGGIGGNGGAGTIDGSAGTGETEAKLKIMTPNNSTELEVILCTILGGKGGDGGPAFNSGTGGAGGTGEGPSFELMTPSGILDSGEGPSSELMAPSGILDSGEGPSSELMVPSGILDSGEGPSFELMVPSGILDSGEGPSFGWEIPSASRDEAIKSCIVEVGDDSVGGPGGAGGGPRIIMSEDMISAGGSRDKLVCVRIVGTPACILYIPNISKLAIGGEGGRGGRGGVGGSGGPGEAPRIRVREEAYASYFFQLVGGRGGEGGGGSVDGGCGGTGGGIVLSKRLVSMGKEARYRVSRLPLDELDLKDRLRRRLHEQGFVTVGGLLEVYDADLKDVGFKIGEIAGLKGALEAFLRSMRTDT